jgi:hypothetical protein
MAAALSGTGKTWLQLASAPSTGDGVWSTDHI